MLRLWATGSPTEFQVPRRGWGAGLRVLAVWGLVAFFSVAQIYLARSALGHPPPLLPLLVLEVPVWAFWAAVTLPIVLVTRRFPLNRAGGVRTSVSVHVAVGIATAVVAVTFQMLWYQAFNPYPLEGTGASIFWEYFRRYFLLGAVVYWAIVGVYHAFAHYVLYRERELEVSRAKTQLTEARLNALKLQIHPHFLFNTLNSVSAMLEREPRAARRVLAQLAELLRASLRSEARHLTSLEDEIGFIERYLDIERIRFEDRLVVRIDVKAAVRRAAVPTFLLQPLVENAVRHGIAKREDAGRLHVTAERSNGSLILHVVDDGPGISGPAVQEGVGLGNTRRRLSELYGGEYGLTFQAGPRGGFDVRVEIPYRVLEADE